MLILSGPVELLILLFLIASWTCDLVSSIYVVLSLLMFCSVDYSVFFACYVFDGVGELFVECVCYLFVCGGCFVAEDDTVVVSLGRFFYFLAHV